MARIPATTPIYHITDIANLPAILHSRGLFSDVALANAGGPQVQIGYQHIKARRMHQYKIDCCNDRFVGEFVPFYFCPRSVMLYVVNQGNSGRPRGCQSTIVHLVSSVDAGLGLGRQWAIADGNAGAAHTGFSTNTAALNDLDWSAIEATSWGGRTHQKSAEFLVADFFPWTAITGIGCANDQVRMQVSHLLSQQAHRPTVSINPNWYY
jgi:hypothetical protein